VEQRTLHVRTQTSVRSLASPGDVYDVISDLLAHLEWSGERASDDTFKLLGLQAPPGAATVGTTFTSSGANHNGTFHDRSVVTEASRPSVFAIETDSRLDRKRGRRGTCTSCTGTTSSPMDRARGSPTPRRSSARGVPGEWELFEASTTKGH
jgi:hypothetical protein